MLNGTFFDIFAVSETKLDANILDDEIKIDGYVSYRMDRNRHGGGVLFYVNNQLESHLLKHLTDSKYESLTRIYVVKIHFVHLCLHLG